MYGANYFSKTLFNFLMQLLQVYPDLTPGHTLLALYGKSVEKKNVLLVHTYIHIVHTNIYTHIHTYIHKYRRTFTNT